MSEYKTSDVIHAMMEAIAPVDKKDRANLLCTLMLKLIEWTPEEGRVKLWQKLDARMQTLGKRIGAVKEVEE